MEVSCVDSALEAAEVSCAGSTSAADVEASCTGSSAGVESDVWSDVVPAVSYASGVGVACSGGVEGEAGLDASSAVSFSAQD